MPDALSDEWDSVYHRQYWSSQKASPRNRMIQNQWDAVAFVFFDHWIVPYGIQVFFLTDSGLQFICKFFET